MRGGKVDKRVVRIIDTTALTVRIIWSCHLAKVTTGPGMNGYCKNGKIQ